MTRRFKIIMQLTLVAVMACSQAGWGAEPTPEELQKQIAQFKKKITQTKVKESAVAGSLLKTQRDINRINANLSNLNNRLGSTEKRITTVHDQLNQAQDELNQIKSNMNHRRDVLDERLVTIYKYGYQSYLEILCNAKNFGEFVSRFEMVGNFVRDDLHNLRLLQEQQEELDRKKQQIADREAELKRQKDLYANLKAQTKQEHNLKLSRAQQQQRELAQIQGDRRLLEQSLDELEELSRKMEAQIRDMQSRNHLSLGTGRLIWPARGRITSPFGYRYHPILRKRKYHSGLDIAVPSGTPVLAADAGVVILSSWNGGYGYCVIIDHGQGVSTLYGHNSALLVRAGATVTKGQQISRSGSTGLSTGPHLHFEVRKNGVPVDPLSFL